MKYTSWVATVLRTLNGLTESTYGGVGLAAVAEAIGVADLTSDDFVKREGLPHALMTAMEDLEAIGLVDFKFVDHGNVVTADGRDVAAVGLTSLWPKIAGIQVSETDRNFLAGLYAAALVSDERSADLLFAETDPIYDGLGLDDPGNRRTSVRYTTFLGDLERKGLIRLESRALGAANRYRPTYLAAVLVSEPDARDRGSEAGLIDWSVPTPGFEVIDERLAELKVRLATARSADDLSDVGRRCRDIAADAVDVVFRADMVPSGQKAPSRQDAKGRLGLYLVARAPGAANVELRSFLRAALALAQARTHSARSGHAAAVAAAQGLLSLVRAIEALERSAGS